MCDAPFLCLGLKKEFLSFFHVLHQLHTLLAVAAAVRLGLSWGPIMVFP